MLALVVMSLLSLLSLPAAQDRGAVSYERGANRALESVPFEGGVLTTSGTLYHLTDHLGNVRAVVDKVGNVYSLNDYGVYGTLKSSPISVPGGLAPAPTGISLRHTLTGKESLLPDFSVPYTDFGARHYRSSLRRWIVPDKLSEKYYDFSPYAYCGANPVNIVDVDGTDWYIFDKDGVFSHKEEHEGKHLIAKMIEEGSSDAGVDYSFYQFADPIHDPKDIDNGIITTLQFIDNETIINYLSSQGTFDDNYSAIDFVLNSNSTSTALFPNYDFSTSVLTDYYHTEQIDYEIKSKYLFIVDGKQYAHNLMNFGNLLWGAAGYTKGINPLILLIGAHLNSLGFFGRHSRGYLGYHPQFDSIDDQLSIYNGIQLAKNKEYRSVR